MKCCVSTDVGTWMNLLTFEPDPDYSPDAGTGLLSPMAYINFITSGLNPTYTYWPPVDDARPQRGNGFIHHEPWEHLCRRYMRSTECPSSLI